MNDGGTELIVILRRRWWYSLKIGLIMKHGLYMGKPMQDVMLSLMIAVSILHLIMVNGRNATMY